MIDLFSSFAVLLPQLLKGVVITLQITVLSATVAFFLSFVVAFARMSHNPFIRVVSTIYVEVFRGTSALVQLFFLFYILPIFGITMPATVTGVVGLGLNIAAYGSEVVRSAIGSVAKGQHEAGHSLGLSKIQTMRLIIIPQAMSLIWPAFGNLLVELVKSSSLVSLITLTDLTFSGIQMVITTGRVFEVWAWVLLLYFCICYPLSLLARVAERRSSNYRRHAR